MKIAASLLIGLIPFAVVAQTNAPTTTTTTTTTSKAASGTTTGAATGATTGATASAGTTTGADAANTVEGPVAKVVAKKKEIYVQGPDKKHEFYFKPNTELTKGGQPAQFSDLKEGTKVRVTFVKVGKRQDPVKVEIMQ